MVSSSTILTEIKSLRNNEYLPAEYIAFHEDLFKEYIETKARLREHTLLKDIPVSRLEQKLQGGVHILDLDHLPYPKEILDTLFHRVCALMIKHGNLDPSQIERLNTAGKEDQFDAGVFMTKAALKDTGYFESLSQSTGIEMEILYYLGFQIGKPLFEILAETIQGKLDPEVWKEGLCPVCGQEPAICKLEREEGRRMLHCWLCNTDWAFPRLQCPFCLNDDQKTLRFFFFEENSPYRVDVCEVCKRYLKTIDERKTGEEKKIYVEVEHIGTIFLDMMAAQEGYVGPQFHIFGSGKNSAPS